MSDSTHTMPLRVSKSYRLLGWVGTTAGTVASGPWSAVAVGGDSGDKEERAPESVQCPCRFYRLFLPQDQDSLGFTPSPPYSQTAKGDQAHEAGLGDIGIDHGNAAACSHRSDGPFYSADTAEILPLYDVRIDIEGARSDITGEKSLGDGTPTPVFSPPIDQGWWEQTT